MKISLTEKLIALAAVALGTWAAIFISTKVMVGILGICK